MELHHLDTSVESLQNFVKVILLHINLNEDDPASDSLDLEEAHAFDHRFLLQILHNAQGALDAFERILLGFTKMTMILKILDIWIKMHVP